MEQDRVDATEEPDSRTTPPVSRRRLVRRGAAVATGLAAGTFVPPRITALNLHLSSASAVSSVGTELYEL